MEEFAYGPDGNRYARKTTWQDGGNTYTEQVRYIGTSEFIEDDSHPAIQTITKNRLTANILRVTIVGTTTDAFFEYAHRDHLGSIEVITDEAGNTKDNLAFEPFGARKASDWTSNIDSTELDDLLALDIDHPRRARGFTGHEHLDRAGFIHMNGRMFDPVLGRFLSPDPIISRPEFSQRWNRYSYVMNSPMSLVDPSGYTEHDDAVRANLPFGSSGVFAGDASIFLALVDIWTTPQGEREMEYLANLQQSIDEQHRGGELPPVLSRELPLEQGSQTDSNQAAALGYGVAVVRATPTVEGLGVTMNYIRFLGPLVDLGILADFKLTNNRYLPDWAYDAANSPFTGGVQTVGGIVSIFGTIEATSAYVAGVRQVGALQNPYLWVFTTSFTLTSGLNKLCNSCFSTAVVDSIETIVFSFQNVEAGTRPPGWRHRTRGLVNE